MLYPRQESEEKIKNQAGKSFELEAYSIIIQTVFSARACVCVCVPVGLMCVHGIISLNYNLSDEA